MNLIVMGIVRGNIRYYTLSCYIRLFEKNREVNNVKETRNRQVSNLSVTWPIFVFIFLAVKLLKFNFISLI